MLVIGRKPGEYILINGNIRINIVKSNDGDLRIAVDAPKDIKVIRGELYEDEQRHSNTK